MSDDLTVEEAENLRRSVFMLQPGSCCDFVRERLLAILGQLVRALERLRKLSDA